MDLEFNGLPVNVIKSNRKTISIQLKSSEIIMRVPRRLGQKEIRALLSEKSAWIEKHQRIIAEQEKKLAELPKFTAEEIQMLADKARKTYGSFKGVLRRSRAGLSRISAMS